MLATGFTNSFTSGEISDDAWDRTDLQPIAKGCEAAVNAVVRVAGPLGKRRGFWRNGALYDQASPGRLIAFARSVDDALMLEFGHLVVRVWQANGQPLMNLGVQVSFASPYAAADLAGLRYKQVGDVIFLRHATGVAPRTLVRSSNTSWAFHLQTFPNGPWLPENEDAAFTLSAAGADEHDLNPDATGAGSILAGQVVTLTASAALFDPAHVGASFRLRATDGAAGVLGWVAGFRPPVGTYGLSDGQVYVETAQGVEDKRVTNPPVHLSGVQSDGSNLWTYRHDGAGVVQITAVAGPTAATGTVTATLPLKSGVATSFWSESAYSDLRGWPRMWPSVREERLVEGATAHTQDFLDLTSTAGFDTVKEDFRPGKGTGKVVDTDAVRRRLGDDGAEILWSMVATYLLVGTASAEYVVAGSVLDEPISPAAVVVKPVSGFGSEDVYPAKAHKGLLFVARGGKTLREMAVDTGQNASGDDLTVLARHIAERRFAQLAWVGQPDETLWTRLGDGGLAAMTYHQEQQVRGWTRQALGGGFLVEDLAVLPGPGRRPTLWLIAVRTKNGAAQRQIWMQSQPEDALFMDGAAAYAGAPATVIGGLAHLEGETVRVLADGAQTDAVVAGGHIVLSTAAAAVSVGLKYALSYKSLKLDVQGPGGTLNTRQRALGAIVSLKCAEAFVGLDGGLRERVCPRLASDVPAMAARRTEQSVTFGGDTSRDPRIVITDDSAYDCVIYSLRPKVAHG